MLIGFIAVVVILLVIIGIMSTGQTAGSGGTDQTKATKLVSEVSGLAQSSGFYKTLTQYGNYEGATTEELKKVGVISKDDYNSTNGTVVSTAIDGLQFNIKALSGKPDYLEVDIENKSGADLDDSLANAIEASLGKFGTGKDDASGTKVGLVGPCDIKSNDSSCKLIFK